MAASSNDPTTGAPVFLDSDAPDPAVNPKQVAEFAAHVGTRPIGSTAERTAYAYAREGLGWYDTNLDAEFLHNGTGWKMTPGRPSMCILDKNIAQNSANGTVVVTWDNTGAVVDTDNYYSTAQNTRITVPFAGVYDVSYKIRTSGQLPLTTVLKVNGSTIVNRGTGSDVGATGAASNVAVTVPLVLAAGDYITLDLGSTGVLALGTAGLSFMSVRFVGEV